MADVRFTPNSDRESGLPQTVMSALAPKADMCGAATDVRFRPKADIRASPARRRWASRPRHQAHSLHLGAGSPDALLVPGRADGRARTIATEVTPAARLCAGRLRIWQDLPDVGKVKSPSHWKRGIRDRIDEGARQSSALSRSGRRAHCLLRRCGTQARR